MNKPTEQERHELEPCPFCPISQVSLYDDDYGFWQIGCGACGSHSGKSKDKEAIVKHWNTRKLSPAMIASIVRMAVELAREDIFGTFYFEKYQTPEQIIAEIMERIK